MKNTETIGSYDAEEAYRELINNSLDWYVVKYTDGSFDVKHHTGLSSILDCGADPKEFDIDELHQCWNGEELGECPF
jgi:hypothetical protein